VRKDQLLIVLFILVFILDACGGPKAVPSPEASPTPTPTATPEEPFAAKVNGEIISEESYQASLKQFEQAQEEKGGLLAEGETAEWRVIDDLIAKQLLSQTARENGFTADEALVEQRFASLSEQAGGADAFSEWLNSYSYNVEGFRKILAVEIEAAWQRDQIVNDVPLTADQVKAHQVVYQDATLAQNAYEQLEAGSPFEAITASADPDNLGYLDWVPRGYLLLPQLDEALFALQPGQHSPVIQTEAGYHILYVIERDPQHPLSADARLVLQAQSLQQWIETRRAESQIEIAAP
jgi:parvulin-like peptidyl-prolyl isomerase